MSSSDDESVASEMSVDAQGFFQDLNAEKTYRLKDAYVDDWSSDEMPSSSEEEPEKEDEVETDQSDEDTDVDGSKADKDEDKGDAGEEEVNAMFKDDEGDSDVPGELEEEDEEDEDKAIQQALERFEAAIEADSDSEEEEEGKPAKEPLPALPDRVEWRFLRLSRPLMKAIEQVGYQLPTPVQAQTIRPILNGMDICCRAVTGSGKTAAFVLPMLDRLRFQSENKPTSVRGLILEPTREIAFQCYNVIQQLSVCTPVSSCVIAGGLPTSNQTRMLQQPVTIAVATPGRLIDLVLNHNCHLNDVEVFVLDEADRLLSCGFQRDIEEILRHLPSRRQTLQFSATMTREVDQLADLALRKPLDIDIGPMGTSQTLRQEFIRVSRGQGYRKPAMLLVICTKFYRRGVMVFCSRRETAHYLHTAFNFLDLRSVELHGGMTQHQRTLALTQFRERTTPIMITTDLAQRGLDIPGCRTVVNYDVPLTIKAYIHRVGRTARMGKQGVAVTFVHDSTDDKALLEQIVKLARINNASALAKGKVVPGDLKTRHLEEADVEEFLAKLKEMEGKLRDHLENEQASKEIDYLERTIKKVEEKVIHGDEPARPKTAWHVTSKEKREIKKKMKEEEAGNHNKQQEEDEKPNRRVAKYNATDLDNRPIKVPAFSKRIREEEKKFKRREMERANQPIRGPQKLSNAERRKKRMVKRKANISKKLASRGIKWDGKKPSTARKERATAARGKGTFKSKARYRRR